MIKITVDTNFCATCSTCNTFGSFCIELKVFGGLKTSGIENRRFCVPAKTLGEARVRKFFRSKNKLKIKVSAIFWQASGLFRKKASGLFSPDCKFNNDKYMLQKNEKTFPVP